MRGSAHAVDGRFHHRLAQTLIHPLSEPSTRELPQRPKMNSGGVPRGVSCFLSDLDCLTATSCLFSRKLFRSAAPIIQGRGSIGQTTFFYLKGERFSYQSRRSPGSVNKNRGCPRKIWEITLLYLLGRQLSCIRELSNSHHMGNQVSPSRVRDS